jgi:hypothetical protein
LLGKRLRVGDPSLPGIHAVVKGAKNQFQIFKAVIRAVSVFMMDMLIGRKVPAEMSFHDKAVLISIIPIDSGHDIAIGLDDTTALPAWIFCPAKAKPALIGTWLRAKAVGILAIGVDLKNLATQGACFCNHAPIVSCGD